MRINNLRRQVSLWLLIPLVALFLVDSWLTYTRAMNAAHVAFDRLLAVSVKSIREGTRLRNGEVEVDLPYLSLDLFGSDSGERIYYLIREESGRAVTGYDDLPLPGKKLKPEPYQTLFYDARYRGADLRMSALRLPLHDVPRAETRTVWILVGETIEPRQALARQILEGSLIQEAVLIAFALVIVWLGVGLGLRPLDKLSAKVAARSEGDSSPLEKTGLPAEVKPLVDSINQYIQRLQQIQESRRRFFTDAAHQLKTPLAIIQAESELALRTSRDPETTIHVDRLNGAVKQAGKGVQQLLSLARLDAHTRSTAQFEPLRLDEIGRSTALDWSPIARTRHIDLGFESEGSVVIEGQYEMLAELCACLVDNAIRYAGNGSVITVRVVRRGEHALLQVVDNGPGIASNEREAVFERFYRGSSAGGVEGSGLGLAIVQEVARLHDAEVELEDAAGGGLVVSVIFKLNGESPTVESIS